MEETLQAFKQQQDRATSLLLKLKAFLEQGAHAGIAVDPSLGDKVETALRETQSGRLKIALVGGFSEGKTSIAAAWLGRLDRSTMKISHEESSDAVVSYAVGDDIIIFDTPGLFGFKEKTNADREDAERYKDITRKYISEAHLVIYVMDPKNPIKESHRDELEWLFRALNLLPRTVFVLSRFDIVADVEDADDFARHLEVKRAMVSKRLAELIQLTPTEQQSLAIVAVAANPFDLGIEHWLANREQFQQLSHIDELRRETSAAVERNGGALAVALAAKQSIIRDVLVKELPVAIEADEQIGAEVEKLEEANRRLKKQLVGVNARIQDVRRNLREFVTSYFTDLILQAKAVDQETFAAFFEREIGAEGIVLTTRLQSEFEQQMASVRLELTNLQIGVESEINHFNAQVRSMGKQGINFLIGRKLINSQTILATRDGIVSVAKVVGVDLAKVLKFKPWGAVNLAKTVNGVLVVVGLVVEAWDWWESNQREKAFQASKAKLIEHFETQRAELISMLASDDFATRFFAEYEDLESQAQGIATELEAREAKRQEFLAWRGQAEALDVEFRMIQESC